MTVPHGFPCWPVLPYPLTVMSLSGDGPCLDHLLLKHVTYFLSTLVVDGSQDLWVTCGYES